MGESKKEPRIFKKELFKTAVLIQLDSIEMAVYPKIASFGDYNQIVHCCNSINYNKAGLEVIFHKWYDLPYHEYSLN